MKTLFALFVFLIISCCSSSSYAYKVGLLMPTQNEIRWYKDGFVLEKKIKNEGLDAELFFAGDGDVALQQRQITRVINEGCDALVIGCIDGSAVTAH